MQPPPAPDRQQMRDRLRARRDALPAGARAAWSMHLAQHGIAALRDRAAGAIVAAYWPLRSEVDPRPLALALTGYGARLALPVVRNEGMEFRAWVPGTDLQPAGFGAFGPPADASVVVPTIVLVPLLAFDARGQRLGWGKGYYDRYLAGPGAEAFAVGVAFACQQVPEVPAEAHDRMLAAVLTERGWLRCGSG